MCFPLSLHLPVSSALLLSSSDRYELESVKVLRCLPTLLVFYQQHQIMLETRDRKKNVLP